MSKKGGNFFEEHIEKVVLAVVGLVCIWLLITRVLISPNKVLYGREKLSPGEIDIRISGQAELLEDKLNREPKPKPPPEQKRGEFIAMMELPLSGVDVNVCWPLPICSSTDFSDNRKYRIPRIGEINEALVEHIRAVAYVPAEEINKDNIYDKDNSEPNDIDFVTVESTIDVAQLAANFYESFAGEDVPEDWRDPCLATPVFGAVQLQRRELLADGGWSGWQSVPRAKIDRRKKMFEVIEDVEGLPPGGVKVRLINFDNKQVMVDLLQPEAYRIASAEEEWFPPSVYKKYVKYQKEVESQERREAIEAERKKREEEREKRFGIRYDENRGSEGRFGSRGYRREVRPGGMRGERERGLVGRIGRPGMERGGSETDRESSAMRRIRRDVGSKKSSADRSKKALKAESMKDFYDEYAKLSITGRTDITKMREPLVFWAHDDTAEPGRSYQYRIRLGVFNPVAGTNQVSGRDKLQKNKVILWSDFSNGTETVEIPARLYFFPHRIQEVAEIVTVKVCRYVFGYWYSRDFRVRQGEVIGKVEAVESKTVKGDEQDKEIAGLTIPETIDYSTGAIYVDAVHVNNWVGGRSMRARPYYDMLYSFDGTSMEHIPISRSYWAQELQIKFREIEELEKRPKKVLRDWGTKAAERKRAPRAETEKLDDTDEEDRERRAVERMKRRRRE